jgi:putative transposase
MSEITYRKKNRLRLPEYQAAKVYSLTLSCNRAEPWFRHPVVVRNCFQALARRVSNAQIELYAFCFMPNHLHLLLGSLDQEFDLIAFVKGFKQETGWWFRNSEWGSLKASPTRPLLWQKSYYDHIIRSDENLRIAAEYILLNPVQAGMTAQIGEYPFAGSLVWEDWIPQALKP